MTNTIIAQPISKLYKRCARGRHESCDGKFSNWSVCVCDCHSAAAVETAEAWIASHAAIAHANAISVAEVIAETAQPKASKPAKAPKTTKSPQYQRTGIPGPSLPSNGHGGLRVPTAEGFKPVNGTWKTYAPKGDERVPYVPGSLDPKHIFTSVLITDENREELAKIMDSRAAVFLGRS